MKKVLFSFLILLFAANPVFARSGGAAFGGALAGSMVGSVVGSAMTKDSGSSRRAEAEARRAQDQTAALRNEQQLRQEMMMSRTSESTRMIMLFSLIFLLIVIAGLAIMLFKRKR